MTTRQIKFSGNTGWSDIIFHIKEVTATNLSAAESYTEDTPKNLTDIVVSKRGQGADTVTVTLTLSNTGAGTLNTGTSGSVTSTFVGGVWTASGAIEDVNALLAALTFTPTVNFNSNFTIAVSVSNGVTPTPLTGTKAMTGSAANDAPVLDTSKSPVLAGVAQNAPAPSGVVGTQVSALVDAVVPTGGLDNVSDIDADSIGIAIVAADSTNGTWYYSINSGSTWNALGAVSNASARLLAPSARLYFHPNTSFTGTATITFRAWDQTSGTNGSTASTTTSGGTTAFSTATDTASITVT